jgi:hypothetical protein
VLPAELHEDHCEQSDEESDDHEEVAVGVTEQADARQLAAEEPAAPVQKADGAGQVLPESQ